MEGYNEDKKAMAKELFCPHEYCGQYGKIGEGNIVFVRQYGKGESQNLFKCHSCERTFSERRGTPLFGMRLAEEKIFLVLRCLVEGNGIRATGRIADVDKDTVVEIVKRFGRHMKAIHDYMMQDYHLEECQLDELWSFVKKTEESDR